jgi:post-segregation antitoxin (ccd killing protein)
MAKILVSLDDKLLARIDKAARALGLNRSAYLSRVVAREVEASRGPGRAAAARRALRRIDKLFAANQHHGDVTRAVRQERDSH